MFLCPGGRQILVKEAVSSRACVFRTLCARRSTVSAQAKRRNISVEPGVLPGQCGLGKSFLSCGADKPTQMHVEQACQTW